MRRFWDARAREDALYFVDSRVPYRAADAERFWSEGAVDLDRLLGAVDARVEPSTRVVEIGCGVGRLTRALAARAEEVVAIDVSAEMLARARRLNPALTNVRWLQGDGVSLAGIGDASADLCVSHVVFQHLPDPAVTLGYVREMGRVLRPGGTAVFGFSNDPAVHRGSLRSALSPRLLFDRLRGRGPRGQGRREWRGSAVPLDDLRAAAGEGGLEVERVAFPGTQYCIVRARRRSP